VVSSSKFPEAESNNSLESSIIASSDITTSFLVPENVGCSLIVVTALKFCNPATVDITAVAFELKLPNLSTALIRYVPTLAGTVIEVAGLDTFVTRLTEFNHSAVPSVFEENLI
jgi:hypothetical protein